jgi:hypothetical protein
MNPRARSRRFAQCRFDDGRLQNPGGASLATAWMASRRGAFRRRRKEIILVMSFIIAWLLGVPISIAVIWYVLSRIA